MFTAEMYESIKKVEATREERMKTEPRRMTAEEKDELLKTYHPDYRAAGFDEIKTCTVTIHFENGYSWESTLELNDTNFFEIADSPDGDIEFIPLNSVDSFEQAVDTVA